MTARRSVLPACAGLTAVLLLAACGGDTPQQAPGAAGGSSAPSTTHAQGATGGATASGSAGASSTSGADGGASGSSAASGGASASGSPSSVVLSRYEDEAPMKAVRGWLAGMGRDINAKASSFPQGGTFVTAAMRPRLGGYGQEDFGLYYPGPVPFTPTSVKVEGDNATVRGCMQANGWAQEKKTKLPARGREVSPVVITVTESGGTWLVDNSVIASAGSCSGVKVKGVAW